MLLNLGFYPIPPQGVGVQFLHSLEVEDDLLIYGVKRLQNATEKLDFEKIAVHIPNR